MGSRELFFSFKETRVSLEPSSPATIVHAQVPAIGGGSGGGGSGSGSARRLTSRLSGSGSGSGSLLGSSEGGADVRSRARSGSSSTGGGGGGGAFDNKSSSHSSSYAFTEEERLYRAKNLASEAGIFHRRHHDAPRSFLWRVLEGGHVLSLRSVDVARHQADPAAAPDALLTLHVHFSKAIRPGCVAFADPAQHDALAVFVLDASSHLHHLLLRPDIFRRRALASEADLGEAWKPYLSATFNFKQPRRLVAVSASEFVVTLNDGGLISFRRDHAHETTTWKESFHSPVGLIQGLRSILPFQGGPTIKYEGSSLEITASASAVVSSLGLDDATFLFSVCLDHRLRVWNVERGEVCYTGDLLGLAREPHELGKWTIDPSQTNLIRLVELGEGVAVLVVFSPVGAGAFKFWKVAADGGGRVVMEPFESAPEPLAPPMPSSSDVWTLADFAVALADPHKLSLWVLWKNNLVYRVMQVSCAPASLPAAWRHDWLGVHVESSVATAQTSGPCDPTDAAEKWLDLIFFPGRFSRATLETALAMFERGIGASRDKAAGGGGGGGGAAASSARSAAAASSSSGRSLMESICSVLGSTAALERGSSGAMDYDLFRSASEIQWRRFYRLLVELDKQRGEALSLVLDPDLGLSWVVCTDCIAVVRECSQLERIYHNAQASLGSGIAGRRSAGAGSKASAKYQKVARLLAAGTTFVDSFSDGMLQASEAALRSELFDDSSFKTDEERIQHLSDRAGFWRHLTEDECAQVVDILGENFDDVDEVAYDALFALLDDVVQQMQGHDVRYPFTQFGQKLVIRGIQDTAELFWQILFRQLILLVHMEFEVEDERAALRTRLDVGQVYIRLVDALKRLELVKWLSRNEFSVALSRSERESLAGSFSGSFSAASGSFSGAGSAGADENPTQTITALQGSVGHLLGLGELAGSVPLASLLTDIVVDMCSSRSTIELDPSMIQCMLLKRDRPDLSLQLSAFASDDPFSTYVQGRTFLALRDYDTAALYFRKAAVGLSVHLRHFSRHSAGLIDDAEWNLFYSGLPNYYAHIVSLFDRQKAYSFVIEFARLSLQFIHSKANRISSTCGGKGSGAGGLGGGAGGSGSFAGDDPAAEAASLALARTEMLSRLFTAAAALSRFDAAHSALLAMGQPFLARAGASITESEGAVDAGSSGAALQRSCLRYLVEKMSETGHVADLLALPFPAGLRDAVDAVLENKCRAAVEVVRGTPWHHILYSWRIAHDNYRGAASVLLDRLNKLQQAGEGDKFLASSAAHDLENGGGGDDVLDTPVTRQYLMLINTLGCVEPKQAWIYAEDPAFRKPAEATARVLPSVETDDSQATQEAPAGQAPENGPPTGQHAAASGDDAMASFLKKAAAAQRPPWRKVVTLADLRKQYQDELDRIAAIQNNQFEFGGGADGGEDITMDDS